MWLTSSSIGRKVVMSISGAALVLFLTFHMAMNLVYIISDEGYNKVCEFLGTNWYALAGTAGLAFLVVVHFIYAFILTIQNKRARGNNAYAISGKQPVGFAAKNMLVLGIIVICGIFFHLYHFWYNMMFAELAGKEGAFAPTDGAAWITFQFSHWYVCAIYVVWFTALWWHITHGIWSSMQTIGLSGKVWLNRWICISKIWAAIIWLGFAAVLVAGVIKSQNCCEGCCEAKAECCEAKVECCEAKAEPCCHEAEAACCQEAEGACCQEACEKQCEKACEKACEEQPACCKGE